MGLSSERSTLLRIVRNGDTGVAIFFVLSGFIIALPFAAHYLKSAPKVDIGQYFFRRLTRLGPSYMLSMVLLFILLSMGGKYEPTVLLPHLGASLLFLHNILYRKMSPVNEVAWSLEVGVQFYAVAPLLCGLFLLNKSVRRWIIIALMAVAAGFQARQLHLFLFSPLLLPGQIQYFLAGMLFADVYLTQLPDQPRENGGWDLIAILAIPVIFLLGRRAMISKVLLPCLLFLLCYSVVRGYAVKRFFSHPLIRTTGAMSYSIYLFHNGIIMLAGPYTKNILASGYGGISLVVQLLVLLPPILLISTCYYILVERPYMNGRWPGMLSEKSKGISAC